MNMKIHRVGIIMNGVTGRMGKNQHLLRSIVEIIKQGGVKISDSECIMPDPILVGRNEAKLKALSELSGVEKYTTDLDSVISDPAYDIYFDAQTTGRRAEAVKLAASNGKHVYCEKPTASDFKTAYDLYEFCEKAGVKHGVVQDKLWLPGMLKLKRLMQKDFLGRSSRCGANLATGYLRVIPSLPSGLPGTTGRKMMGASSWICCATGGMCWTIFLGRFKAVSCLGATHIKERVDEQGNAYKATADDAAYATFQLEGGIVAHFNSSWCVRVRRDDLLTIQVDGTKGSAVAGLRECYTQHYGNTPKPVWNPDIEQPIHFYDGWSKVPEQEVFENAFKVQWELFLKHVVKDEPFPWDLKEGAKGVQLAEKGLESWDKKAWVDLPEI